MIDCVLYARVSSEGQEKEGTIESQIAKLRQYAARKEYAITKEYVDNGYSGELKERPALQSLQSDAAHKSFTRVIVLTSDRLFRNPLFSELLVHTLEKQGVHIEFTDQSNDGSAVGDLTRQMVAAIAFYEKRQFLERCKRGRQFKAENGQIMTSRPPHGYRYIRKSPTAGGHLVINEAEAANVRLIFSLCVDQGLSVSGIIRELRARNISPIGRSGKGLVWAPSTIKRILHNESYAGTWHFGKHYSAEPYRRRNPGSYTRMLKTSTRLRDKKMWVPITVPAILERSTFDRAQEQIKKNGALSPRNKINFYLLGGLCRCGDCGQTYQGIPSHGKLFYRCNGPRSNRFIPRTCFNPSHSAPKIETAVWSTLSAALRNPMLLSERLEGVKSWLKKGSIHLEVEHQDIEKEKAKLFQAEDRLLDALSDNLITKDQMHLQMGKVKERRTNVAEREAALRQAMPKAVASEDVERYCKALSKGLAKVERDPLKKRELVKMLIQTITIKRSELVISGAIPAQLAPTMQGDVSAPSGGCWGRYTAIPFELVIRLPESAGGVR